MTFVKYLQRKIYDALSDKPLILCFIILLCVFFIMCQAYEVYVISSRSIWKAVCDDKCCDNIGSVCKSCDHVDVVYTWVNGSDPIWLNSIKKYATDEKFSFVDFDPSRYDDKQELKYSLRSLDLYAPWIRKVYIVTADQLPWWLDIWNPKVQIVTHEEIIPHDLLPTFSSPSIEYFLHKIPGLSEKFLYFNDDIFLGAPLYLSDLYTETDGYEVYTAWNVPECASGCPWSFLGDNSCDTPCNNDECDFDGGDCSDIIKSKQTIANGLNYLDDYADNAFLDEDDLSNNEKNSRYDEVEFDSKVLQERQLGSEKTFNNLFMDRKHENSISEVKSNVEDVFWGVDDGFIEEKRSMRGLKSIQMDRSERADQDNVVKSKTKNENMISKFKLENSYSYSNITRNKTVHSYKVHNKPNVDLISLVAESSRRSLNISRVVDKYNKKYLNIIRKRRKNKIMEVKKKEERKLAMYAQSLIYTNKIFNKVYGFQNRKVPAHLPFLLDRSVIEKLQKKFKDYVEITTRNKFRRGNDFQFSFSYYHYLLSEKRQLTIEEIFDKYDTDESGTWSDREIRTVLAKVRGLPLTFEVVRALESAARHCDKAEYRAHPTPPNERYLDSEMVTTLPFLMFQPTLTKALVVDCERIRKPLIKTLGTQRPNAVARPAGHRHTFVMLESNITKAINSLDEIRRNTRKFICINDNLDPKLEEETIIVRMMLQELYEALLPMPSQFELPEGIGNRFLRISELQNWRNGRKQALFGLCICALILLFISFYHIKSLVRHTYTRVHNLF